MLFSLSSPFLLQHLRRCLLIVIVLLLQIRFYSSAVSVRWPYYSFSLHFLGLSFTKLVKLSDSRSRNLSPPMHLVFSSSSLPQIPFLLHRWELLWYNLYIYIHTQFVSVFFLFIYNNVGFSSLTNYIIVINMLDLQVDRISNTTQFLYNYFNNSLLSFLFLLKISSPFPPINGGVKVRKY